MKATIKLLNSYFWKTYYGPILVFLFPSLLLGILGHIMRIEYIFPGIIAMVTLFIAVQTMPLGIMEMKNSTLFKYIGSTSLGSKRFMFSVVLYYLFINIISILLLMSMSCLLFYKDIFYYSTNSADATLGLYSGILTLKGGLSFISANLIHILMSLAIGLMLAAFSRTPQQALTIGFIIVIPSMFLSGMVISVDIIAKSKVMQILSKLIIFRYTTANIIVSSTPTYQLGNILQQISNESQLVLIFNKDNLIQINHVWYLDISKGKQHLVDEHLVLLLKPWWSEHESIITKKIAASGKPHLLSILDIKQIMNHKIIKDNRVFLDAFKKCIFPGGDATLFSLIFQNSSFINSGNNIFNFLEPWGVRKIATISEIKDFIITYFKGDTSLTEQEKTAKFLVIWHDYIRKGNFSFLNMFINQNTKLYSVLDRILNILLPEIIMLASIFVVSRKFTWSNR